MMSRWEDVVALAGEIEHARRIGATIDPEKARKLATLVLALEHNPPRAHDVPIEREPLSSP